jgi:preprotein translocase subunit SecE
MKKFLDYLNQSKGELLKVTWPSQEQIVRYTIAVVIVSAVVAVFLGALDLGISGLVEKYLLQ